MKDRYRGLMTHHQMLNMGAGEYTGYYIYKFTNQMYTLFNHLGGLQQLRAPLDPDEQRGFNDYETQSRVFIKNLAMAMTGLHIEFIEEKKVTTPSVIASDLLTHLNECVDAPDIHKSDLSEALNTLSEGGMFEEDDISPETAVKCWKLVQYLTANELPGQYKL